MPMRRWVCSAGVAIRAAVCLLVLIQATPASACPKCKAGVLAEKDPKTGASHKSQHTHDTVCEHCKHDASSDPKTLMTHAGNYPPTGTGADQLGDRGEGWSFVAGVDFTNAYFHRGHLMGDSGVIVQPYVTVSKPVYEKDDLTITPYFSFWNSLQEGLTVESSGGGGSAHHAPAGATNITYGETNWTWYEAELMGGVVVTKGPLTLDLRYNAYLYPDRTFHSRQEIDLEVSYDIAPMFRKPDSGSRFSLRPYVEIAHETEGDYKDTELYMEAGLEPAWVQKVGSTRLGLSVPIAVGLSPDNYFQDEDGGNEPIGFYSVSVKAALPIGNNKWLGQAYLTGEVAYLHLVAESVQTVNGGGQDEVIGKIGVSFVR